MAKSKKFTYEYARPALTVDLVIVTREARPRVLLIERKGDPFAGSWALPGGFVNEGETLEQAARRELQEETNVKVDVIEQLYTAGDPGRDPRGWVVSVSFLTRVDHRKLQLKAGDDAADVALHVLDEPPTMAFDHAMLLEQARTRLRNER